MGPHGLQRLFLGGADAALQAQCSAECNASVLGRRAGRTTSGVPTSCGERIRWLSAQHKHDSLARSCVKVAEEFPDACGPCLPDFYRWKGGPACTRRALLTIAGVPPRNPASCATRISWRYYSNGRDEYDACRFVADEFPDECGACGEPFCEGAFGLPCSHGGGRSPAPPDWTSHPLTRCAANETAVMGYSTHMSKQVCHECAGADCPVLAGRTNPEFNAAAQRLVPRWLASAAGRPFRAFNPSSVRHRGGMLVVARVNNQTRCRGDGYIRAETPSAGMSHVGLCRLEPPAAREEWAALQDCRLLEADYDGLLRASGWLGLGVYSYPTSAVFAGAEDPRGFTLNGTLYVYAKMLLNMTSQMTSRQVDRIVLLRVDEASRRATRLTVLYPAASGATCKDTSRAAEKNWVFLRTDGAEHVLFAHSFSPFLITRCHVATGCCLLARTIETGDTLDGYRGGAPAVELADGRFWLILHRRVDLQGAAAEFALPPIYHHRMVVLDLATADPSASVSLVGGPFRLPVSPTSSAGGNDIQFVSGLHVEGAFAYLLYGAADCDAMMHRIPFDAAAHLAPFGPSRRPFTVEPPANAARDPPSTASATLRVEGPIHSTESFAEVNRHIMKALMPLTRREPSMEEPSMEGPSESFGGPALLLHGLDMSLFDPRTRHIAMCAGAPAPCRLLPKPRRGARRARLEPSERGLRRPRRADDSQRVAARVLTAAARAARRLFPMGVLPHPRRVRRVDNLDPGRGVGADQVCQGRSAIQRRAGATRSRGAAREPSRGPSRGGGQGHDGSS